MVNPGAFQGSRKEFMLSQREIYSQAVADGHAAETAAEIQRKYFKRFPVDLPHEKEPTPEHLAAVDDDAMDPDYEEPDADKLSPDDYTAAMAVVEVRRRTLAFRKAQIKRWLAYQHMKDHDLDPTETGARNPYRPLLFKLTGKGSNPPRLKSPVNVWRVSHKAEIEKTLNIRATLHGTKRAGLVKLREQIARELYGKLDEAEQRSWKAAAMEEQREAVAAWKVEMESPPSTDPADRQKCIMGLVRFAQPILDLISEATGWKATLIAGGPEPAHDGRLGIMSIHSGCTTGDVPMNFGRAERLRYKTHIVPIFGSFLQKCYSPEECRSRALNRDEGYMSMENLDLDPDEVNFDTISQQSNSATQPPTNDSSDSVLGRSDIANSEFASQIAQAPAAAGAATVTSQPSPASAASPPLPGGSHSPAPSPPASPGGGHSPVPSPPPSPGGGGSPVPSPPPSPTQLPAPHLPSTPHSSLGGRACLPSTEPASRLSPPPPESTSAGLEEGGSISRARKRAHDGLDHGDPSSTVAPQGEEPEPPRKRREIGKTGAGPAAAKSSVQRGPNRKKKKGSRSAPKAHRTPALPLAPSDLNAGMLPTSKPAASKPAASTRSVTTTTSADAPKWFSTALAMFRHEDVGSSERWKAMVDTWATFEAQSGYTEVSRLKSTKRPTAVAEWIQRARSPTWRPVIKNIDEYGASFVDWWTALQPDWRLSDDKRTILSKHVGGDWAVLSRPGVNGLVSVVAALFYWGCAVQAANEGQEAWLAAVEDCLTVYEHLLTSS
ncbi:hypothetical protein GALMADRAFT_136178 [Galerina marginata CBS 339.88]|uniref:Uncharacterized protein n=1 Tax=Galerina marginata (strain CBS 339.88) TaxID=685588 RepID=A0A067TD44_GALM3|nr:hypothetical protein GALMADRAFT_136178 [Galerina marginata CBS 339.88]